MALKDFSRVGVISGVKGLQGEMRVHFFAGEASWLKKLKTILLIRVPSKNQATHSSFSAENKTAQANKPATESKPANENKPESKTENIIEKKIIFFKPEGKGFLLKVEGVTTREGAEAMKGYEILVSDNFFESKKGENIFLGEILGYKVFDQEEMIGEISDFQTNTAQDLLVVKSLTEEILIPFIKPFILKIDHEKKEVRMQLPEGLITVNRAL
jgi:16S rRNA processing protein RimM